MFKNRISLFVATFLIIGFFFLALPEKGFTGFTFGCCIDPDASGGICVGCGSGCATSEGFCLDNGGILMDDGGVCRLKTGAQCDSTPEDTGCCLISEGNCNDGQEVGSCDGEGIVWFEGDSCSNVPQCAPPAVPTLSEWGLIAMAGVLGIVGYLVIRRRKVTA